MPQWLAVNGNSVILADAVPSFQLSLYNLVVFFQVIKASTERIHQFSPHSGCS